MTRLRPDRSTIEDPRGNSCAGFPKAGETEVMLLRRAVVGDELAVAEVHVGSWQAAYRGLLPESYLARLDLVERAKRYTFAADGSDSPLTTVAVADATICGFTTVGPARDADAEGVGELYAIYVDPSWWGRGVGRALIGEARRLLVQRGHTEAVLWVLAGNSRAEGFYRGDGWRLDGSARREKIGAGWHPDGAVVVDELRYRRALP
jgi:GNAT superfamily N-acetyltransferase